MSESEIDTIPKSSLKNRIKSVIQNRKVQLAATVVTTALLTAYLAKNEAFVGFLADSPDVIEATATELA